MMHRMWGCDGNSGEHMRYDLITKYDLRLPRYTSYPTAPHFTPEVTESTYKKWLQDIPAQMPLSLYLHIAYCAEMCWFCGCHTKITKRYAPIADYCDALLSEIDLVGAVFAGEKRPVKHVHFGGGSPTSLTAADFQAVVNRIKQHFAITADAEIAVELDPRTATPDYVKAMADVGVNRASLGVQDFHPDVQKAINRIQPYAQVAEVIAWLRHNGITDLNMDLVYGLPHQTTDTLLETIDMTLALQPKRVSLFGYAHVPWMKTHQKLIPESVLPQAEARWHQYEAATQHFKDKGYVAVGLDHFAAPDDPLAIALGNGTLNRNFQGYTTDTAEALIGLGASGIGSLPSGYVANEGEVNAYKKTVRSGHLPTKRGVPLQGQDTVRRAVIERLMCDMKVDLAAVCARFALPEDTFDAELARMAPYVDDGIVLREQRTLTMTDDGRALVRLIAAEFDQYLKKGEQRHSRAV